MTRLRTGISALFIAALGLCEGVVAQSDRPNVIFIYTDDQGSVDMGAYGATDLVTPHMDALAARGVRFTQFYAPAPVCSPSRAALLTGRYNLRAGVPGNVSSLKGQAGMPTEQITLAEVLGEAGYATAHIGKWHLGYTPETMPNGQGFDHSFGHMGGCIDNYSHFFYWNGPNRHDLWRNGEEVHEAGRFFPDLMVEEASQWMAEHQDEPFFIYFALNAPHYPLQGSAKWLKYYKEKGVPYPRDLYAAFVSTMDESIGALMASVDELGLREETIVIFQSDHGHSMEERTHSGGGSAGPYRGAKFSMFEGGIRVPTIISWPGHIPEGETRNQMGHGCDWFPTVMELCGVERGGLDLDGESLTEVIDSADAPSPHDVAHWQVGRSRLSQWAVRQGPWKLIGNPRDASNKAPLTDDDKLFLVNLEQDVSELENLAPAYPEKVQALLTLHEDWRAAIP